ncbi:hypothetical protein DL89DRAFT_299119 [Linderina pennispora]|uniref:RGS domain-containing protein n=1 Tax=Linderina pennispora TaxID=61395 RepID=A0A1Y1WJH5_9FUNG|nr:uncharacterized protein DL89DRAFT_299119 [Linderina pennispora]ORX73730.1 hypothetical protein DL89DRAFT_299119 [Linderina pennispora]
MASDPTSSIPEWEVGTTNFKVRAGVMFGCYILYTLYVVVTTVMFYRLSRDPNSELSKRSVKLVFIQIIGCFIVGSLGAIGTALNTWACFPKLWMFNIGFVVLISSLTARGVQLIVASNIHSLSGQLQQKDKAISKAMALTIGEQLAWPPSFNSRKAGQDGYAQRVSEFSCDADGQTLVDMLQKRLQRYRRLGRFVTDRAMMCYIGIMTLILNKEYSISPVSTQCSFIWGLLPVFGIVAVFVLVISPVLLIKIWRFKDAFGIRNDLIICVVAGFICIVFSLIWELEMPTVRKIWSGLFFMWAATILVHTSSVAIPLYRAMRHSKILELEMIHGDSLGTSTMFFLGAKLTTDSKVPRKTRQAEFKQILDDPSAYSRFREFAATCFSSELTGFIDEYRLLKDATIAALGSQDELSSGINSSIRTLTPAYMDSETFASAEHLPELPHLSRETDGKCNAIGRVPLDPTASPMVSILEAVQVYYPNLDIDESTVFPSAAMDMLVSIFSVYLNPRSPMGLNVSQVVMSRVQEHLYQDIIPLTILDEIKEEVMHMLYADIYTRYCRL